MPAAPTTRAYHSPLRARQAAATRRTITEAALGLFARHGWAATTLPMVATAAGVSVDTIYAAFGTKSALLLAAVDLGIVGDHEEARMVDRADFARLGVGRRPERLRAGVRYTMDAYARSVPILRTLREAAAGDDVARARNARYDEDRHEVVAAGMALILGQPAPPALVDAVWALVSPEVYASLLDGRGWSPEQVEDWFVDLARAAIARA
jgi:AcrR family transcriptional regulator